jgi:hypothetical protein
MTSILCLPRPRLAEAARENPDAPSTWAAERRFLERVAFLARAMPELDLPPDPLLLVGAIDTLAVRRRLRRSSAGGPTRGPPC